jgi:nucleoside-diphosphate-sugar epimerase
LNEARLANVAGTAHMLAFARECDELRKFAHLSTVYVVGRHEGRISEERLERQPSFSNTYQQSKYEAEQIVFDAMSRLPASIVRLSSIIGDSRGGKVEQYNYVHHLVKLLCRNVLPVAPSNPEARIDLLPTDWAIHSLAELLDRRFMPGRVYHVCAGPDASPTLPEIIKATIEVFTAHPEGRLWLPLRMPRLVPLQEYEAFAQETRQGGDRLLTEVLRVLDFFLPHLGLRQEFLPSAELSPPKVLETYRRVIRWCLDTNWGLRPPRAEGDAEVK